MQHVSARLLADLWRVPLGVDARSSLGGTTRFGLWESPTGLYFFDPPREGDATFYEGFYRNRTMRRYLRDADRSEFRMAARHVRDGDRVLDVGCGFGPFRHHVPAARYLGLDPHFAGGDGEAWARRESLADHLVAQAGAYDVVTAFQVMEHVADPLAFLGRLAQATRAGGKVIVGVPQIGGAHTRIPNYPVNAVPHHLTWWTEEALRAAAERVGLRPVSVAPAPWSRRDAVVYWMSRFSPVTCRTAHYRHAWTWHLAAAWAALAAPLATRLLPVPSPDVDPGISLLMVAGKPDA